MFNLGLYIYFLNLDLNKTKVLQNLGSTKFVIRSNMSFFKYIHILILLFSDKLKNLPIKSSTIRQLVKSVYLNLQCYIIQQNLNSAENSTFSNTKAENEASAVDKTSENIGKGVTMINHFSLGILIGKKKL